MTAVCRPTQMLAGLSVRHLRALWEVCSLGRQESPWERGPVLESNSMPGTKRPYWEVSTGTPIPSYFVTRIFFFLAMLRFLSFHMMLRIVLSSLLKNSI